MMGSLAVSGSFSPKNGFLRPWQALARCLELSEIWSSDAPEDHRMCCVPFVNANPMPGVQESFASSHGWFLQRFAVCSSALWDFFVRQQTTMARHYAALGRDIAGAQAVNLVPAEKPQDVYTFVLNVVKKKVGMLGPGGIVIFQLYIHVPYISPL